MILHINLKNQDNNNIIQQSQKEQNSIYMFNLKNGVKNLKIPIHWFL